MHLGRSTAPLIHLGSEVLPEDGDRDVRVLLIDEALESGPRVGLRLEQLDIEGSARPGAILLELDRVLGTDRAQGVEEPLLDRLVCALRNDGAKDRQAVLFRPPSPVSQRPPADQEWDRQTTNKPGLPRRIATVRRVERPVAESGL